ncbi:hypothetical protein [Streptomyces sp. NBC_01750]|nr:hypothetical protein [Streptomyces sp. NBC_01750]WSD31306.1 hypothetical protein OG966_04800 [Streptomyces sp. NBC_01750]
MWRAVDDAFHVAVAQYAAQRDVVMSREDIEQEVRNAARRADGDPAVE